MRDGLKWSDGTDLTAKDFEYTMKRIADPKTAAPYAETVVGMVDGYKDVVATGDVDKLNVVASEDGKTLTITLSYPCAYYDKLVAFGTMSPVQQATVEANSDAWATKPETYICNGPYMIKEWVPRAKRSFVLKTPTTLADGIQAESLLTKSHSFFLKIQAQHMQLTQTDRLFLSKTFLQKKSPA